MFIVRCIHLKIHEVHTLNPGGDDSFSQSFLGAPCLLIQVPDDVKQSSRGQATSWWPYLGPVNH